MKNAERIAPADKTPSLDTIKSEALQAATGIGDRCTVERCDVDGNGEITVTDGVNVLRLAADLPAFTACPLVPALRLTADMKAAGSVAEMLEAVRVATRSRWLTVSS